MANTVRSTYTTRGSAGTAPSVPAGTNPKNPREATNDEIANNSHTQTLLDWLMDVWEAYSLHKETFYLPEDFVDRFLGLASPVPKNRLHLIFITWLFMGSKIEESCPPKLEEFAYVTDGACTEKEILQMELVISKGLNGGQITIGDLRDLSLGQEEGKPDTRQMGVQGQGPPDTRIRTKD